MAKSKKAEEKASAKRQKEEKKKQNKDDKAHDFISDVQVIIQGKIAKGTNISRDAVKKNSRPKQGNKVSKPVSAKFFKHKAEFSDKIVLGNKKKKVLEYSQVKMIEQLDSDNRKAFVNYETPKHDYFVVLGMNDSDKVRKFMNLVRDANPNAEIRWPEEPSTVGSENDIVEEIREPSSTVDQSIIETYNEESHHGYRDQNPVSDQGSAYHHPRTYSPEPIKPWTTTSSFICADPHMDDGTVYSRGTPDTFATQMSKSRRRSRRRDSYDSYDDTDDDRRVNGLTTHYYYAGPSDEDDDDDKYRHKSKKSHSNPRRQHYALDDDISISMNLSSTVTEIEYLTPEVYKTKTPSNYSRPPSQKRPGSRKPSKRSKSRELPLSEAEKSRGGWHSDVMFVTPTKDGGVKVSADGPVMLYTATRANVNHDSDDDSTSDGESDFSYTSGTTLTLENPEMPGAYSENYTGGHR